jgi:hypothetical protein
LPRRDFAPWCSSPVSSYLRPISGYPPLRRK